jgi:cytoskeleton protein RodZ
VTDSVLNVGAELQRAREARGLALSEVAQQLKFAPRQLEALEQDRFDLLPGGTFARGMVRNYARLLRIDPEPLLRSVGERYEAPDANTLAARYRQPVPFSDNARRSTFVYVGLSLIVLAIGGGVAWQWQHERGMPAPLARAAKSQPQAITADEPRAAEKVEKKARPAEEKVAKKSRPAEAAPKVAEATAPRPVEASAPKAAPAPVAKAASIELAPKSDPQAPAVEKTALTKLLPVASVGPGVHRLVIRCAEDAWIEVRTDEGRGLISSLNPAGSERSVRARGPLSLVIGNPSHVTVLHNDRPLDLEPYVKSGIARFTLP